MKVQSAKAKGRRLQQEVAAQLLRTFPQLHNDDVRSTAMGAPGEDIQLSHAARQLFPYSIECKNCERLNIWGAIEQARRNGTSDGVTPIVVFRKNKEPSHVVVPLDHFLEVLSSRRT
eukprot:6213346-Pleurochrysis_carterae.AAC.6